MVHVKFCLLLAALNACCVLGSSGDVSTEKTVLIPIPRSLPKVQKENTKATPVEYKNNTQTVAPSPIPPETTKSLPSNTTTTTTTTTSTTTPQPSPTPTPTPPPAPTPAPGPLPAPEQHTWHYTNATDNVTCIIVQFAAQLNITYSKTTVNNDTSLAYVMLNVPANASVVGGDCGTSEQIITLSWVAPPTSNFTNTMQFTYAKNDTTKTYVLKSLGLELSPDLFVNASFITPLVLKHGAAWPTPLTTSYRCMPPTRFNMTGDSVSMSAASLTFTKLQEEAFRTLNTTTEFSAARECGGDVPDAVPIAVGCALGGLVLVVLVAYLVGRRRSNARGYLSM